MFIDGGSTKIALPVRRRDSLEIRVIFGIQQPEGERGCVERCFARRTKPRSVKEKKNGATKGDLIADSSRCSGWQDARRTVTILNLHGAFNRRAFSATPLNALFSRLTFVELYTQFTTNIGDHYWQYFRY